MKTTITMTSKGQFTLPAATRRVMGLDRKGAKANLVFDEATHRLYFEKATGLDELVKMNQAIMRREKTSLKSYKSGDGFAHHVAEKYSKLQ